MTKEKRTFRPIRSENVCHAYDLLHKKGYIAFPITSNARKAVDAITANINSAYFGRDVYDTPEKKLVALLYFIIKDHPFTDGNKRTASLIFEVGCEINGLKPNYEGYTLDALAVFIEEEKRNNYQQFIAEIAEIVFK